MCNEHLERARTLSVAAGAAISGAIVAVGVAIVLNGGFFSAPGAPVPMGIAAALAGSAAGLLGAALNALQLFIACGGLHPTCDGRFYNLRNAIAGAAAAASAWSGICAAIAFGAWAPWIAIPPMIAAVGGLGVTAGLIGTVAYMWTQVRECSSAAARAAGALEPGERPSDPWWLRLRPVTGKTEYAWPEGEHLHLVPGTEETTRLDVYGSELSFGRYTIGEWRLEAVARVTGSVKGTIEFSWTLDGEPLSGATTDSSGRESTLSTTVPPRPPIAGPGLGYELTGESELQVTARDTATGRVVAKGAMVTLPRESRLGFGRMVLPLLPLELESPVLESRLRTRLTRAGDLLVRAVRVANPLPRGVPVAAGDSDRVRLGAGTTHHG